MIVARYILSLFSATLNISISLFHYNLVMCVIVYCLFSKPYNKCFFQFSFLWNILFKRRQTVTILLQLYHLLFHFTFKTKDNIIWWIAHLCYNPYSSDSSHKWHNLKRLLYHNYFLYKTICHTSVLLTTFIFVFFHLKIYYKKIWWILPLDVPYVNNNSCHNFVIDDTFDSHFINISYFNARQAVVMLWPSQNWHFHFAFKSSDNILW